MHFKLGRNHIDIHRYRKEIYAPIYNSTVDLQSEYPEVYNCRGERMVFYFIRDCHTAHEPYGESDYIIWDRYNFGLKTHFYSHKSMLQTMGKPVRKYGYLCESRAIVPEDYEIFNKYKGLEKEFDSIFTYDERILNQLDNARFVPYCAGYWYGKHKEGVSVKADAYGEKTKNISILSSEKTYCRMHILRKELALKCKREHLADTYGTFDGGRYSPIEDSLQYYRFSIVIENDISPYFFTEKLTSCFAAQTIPVYLGASKADEFFNPEGMIQIKEKDIENIAGVLKQCTKEEYERRLPAVIDNYNRVISEYDKPDDWIYRKYLKK